MDTTKVIVTLLVLTIILSIATVAFTAFSSNKAVIVSQEGASTATVGLYVEGGQPATGSSNVGLYVENNK